MKTKPVVVCHSEDAVNKRVGSMWKTGSRLAGLLRTRRDVLESDKRYHMYAA